MSAPPDTLFVDAAMQLLDRTTEHRQAMIQVLPALRTLANGEWQDPRPECAIGGRPREQERALISYDCAAPVDRPHREAEVAGGERAGSHSGCACSSPQMKPTMSGWLRKRSGVKVNT